MGLKPVNDGEQTTAITVMAPVKGRDLQVTTIERSQEPQVFGVLMLQLITQGAGNLGRLSDSDRLRFLADIGFLVSEERVSTPIWFVCDLDHPLNEFAPTGARQNIVHVDSVTDLVVAPSLRHFGREGFPSKMRGRLNLQNRLSRIDRGSGLKAKG